MGKDYKQQDIQRILHYLRRRYPPTQRCRPSLAYLALFELEQDGRLEVLEREVLGAPILIRKIQKMKIS